MALTDWVLLAESALWISGLAIIVASLSWASWRAARAGASLGTALAAHGVRRYLSLGIALLGTGLLASARTELERTVWLFSLLILAWQGRRAVRRGTSTAMADTSHRFGQARPKDVATAGPVHQVASWVVRSEPLLVLLLSPMLMFPTSLTAWLAPLLALPWMARRLTHGRFTTRTAFDVPILLLIVMLPVGMWASMDVQRSMPKLYGILLGLAVYYAIVNGVRRPSQSWRAGLGLALLGLAVTGLALVGTDWPVRDDSVLPSAYRHLPETITQLGGSLAEGFNPNEVAAALTLFIPFVSALLLLGFVQADSGTEQGLLSTDGRLGALARRPWLPTAFLALALFLMMGTVALTLSRSAWLGIGVALPLLACFRPRRLWPIVLLVPAIVALAWRPSGAPEALLQVLLAVPDTGLRTTRSEIWQRALLMIRDFPYTGVGLNMYSETANSLYPLLTAPPERVLQLTHAHNVYLQVAVDLGIPGLVAYLAILAGFGMAWLHTYRQFTSQPLRALSAGLLCSMFAYHVYGLADCLTLGAKPGVVIWAMWGLMAALANLDSQNRRLNPTQQG